MLLLFYTMAAVTVNLTPIDIETFTQYFKDQDIQIAGTFDKPLFKLADVAKKIDDIHYYGKATISYGEKWMIHIGKAKIKYLTEDGLYEYLFTSNKAKAVEFRDLVRNILRQIRTQLIDEVEFHKRLTTSMCMFDDDKINDDVRVDRAIAKFINEYPNSSKYMMQITTEDRDNLKDATKVGEQYLRSSIYKLVLKMDPKWSPPKVQYKLPDWM